MITGDMIVDYEMATPDEFFEFYSDLKYSGLEEKAMRDDKNDE